MQFLINSIQEKIWLLFSLFLIDEYFNRWISDTNIRYLKIIKNIIIIENKK